MFHRRIPYNILLRILKNGFSSTENSLSRLTDCQDVLEHTEMIFQDVRKNALQAFIKYKAYYDKKPRPQNLNKAITSLYYRQKQITKGVK